MMIWQCSRFRDRNLIYVKTDKETPFYYVILSPCIRIQNIEHAILRCPDSIHRVDRNELRDYEQVTTWRHENRSSKRVGVKSKSHLKSYVLIARKEILGRQKKKKRNFKVNFAACNGDAHSNGRLADSGDRRKLVLRQTLVCN